MRPRSRPRLDSRLAWAVLLPAAAGVQTAASLAPSAVERVYSRALYPVIGRTLAAATGWLPFSVAEWTLAALVAAAAVLAGLGVGRVVRRRVSWAGLFALAGRGLTAASLVYLLFLAVWGLNYQRLPLSASAGLDTRPGDAAELAALSRELVQLANQLRPEGPVDDTGVLELVDGRAGALRRARPGFDADPDPALRSAFPPPKRVVLSPVMSYLGISGVYFPFTAEANVNMTVPDPGLPFAACHEMAHQRGYAREDEANFLGYRACLRHPDRDFRYSGALAASEYAAAALARVDRGLWRAVESERSAEVRRDIAALLAWADRYRGPVSRAGRVVNDRYLRSQGEAAGVRSYGRMVDLLLAERRARGGGPGVGR